MMLAGAAAVQVGAANLRNPCACKERIDMSAISNGELRY